MVDGKSAPELRRILVKMSDPSTDPAKRARELEEFAAALVDRVGSLEEKAGRGPRDPHLLRGFIRRIAALREPSELLEDISDLAVKELGAARCAIFLPDCEGKRLVFRAGRGADREARGPSAPIGQGILGHVARTGKPLLVRDPREDPRFAGETPPLEGPGALVCAPLLAEDKILGVIAVSGRDGPDFAEDDLRLLADLGETAGIALRNALHHRETEESGVFIANILESLNLGLLVVDPDRRVRMANAEFLRIFETCRDKVLGDSCCCAVGNSLGDAMARLLDRAWEEGEDQQLEIIRETRRGGSLPLQVAVTLFRNRQMDIIGTLVLFKDLSESRELDRLRDLEKIKSNFVSTVSHELRTPLASMIGSISLLRTGMAGEVTGKQKRLLDILHRNSYRLKELIEDILDLSRLESAEASLDREDVNLLDLVGDAAGSLLETAEKKGVGISIGDGLDLRVRADPGKIRRVLLNLIGNAVKFTPEGGRVRILGEADGESVSISVEDTGIGIPEAEQAKVFDKFYQVEDALVRTAQGSGLGLSICKHIVEMHGGEIGVRSTPGKGSCFRFRIPRGEPKTSETDSGKTERKKGALPNVET